MNLSNYDQTIPGLPNGVYYGQYERNDEINIRILDRDVPDQPLPPNFDPRPVMTKYALFPMLDNRMPANVPIQPNYNYSLETNFTPPVQSCGPVSGYVNHVATENQLRNQYFAIQRGADQAIYVPKSDSDLYKVYIPSTPSEQLYPLLFIEPAFSQTKHPNVANAPHIGRDTFHNNTRSQLKE